MNANRHAILCLPNLRGVGNRKGESERVVHSSPTCPHLSIGARCTDAQVNAAVLSPMFAAATWADRPISAAFDFYAHVFLLIGDEIFLKKRVYQTNTAECMLG